MPTLLIGKKRCFYQDLGEGYPIILGHSYLWNSKMWKPQLSIWSKEFRCIAIDLWDHGESDHLDAKNYFIEQIADDYWELMQILGISECAIVGLSVGGMWATHFALKYPQAVSALVLMDTFVGAEPLAAQQKYFALLDIIERERGFSKTMLDQIVPLFFSPYTLAHKKDLVDDFKKSLINLNEENIPGIVALGRGIFSRNCFLNELHKIKQPTLVLVGKDDIPRPPKESEEMVSRLPNAKLHVIDNAGHICNLEQPDIVNEHLLHFFHLYRSSSRSCVV